LTGLLHQDVSVAREWLSKQVKKIIMPPTARLYIASGNWDLFDGKVVRESEIAGGGFEPPTFGL